MNDIQLLNPQKELTVSSFILRPNGLEAVGNPTFEEWLKCGDFIKQSARSIHFLLGDWLNYGERRWGEKYKEAIELTGFDYSTLRDDKWVAGQVELSRRRDNLPFDHHRRVADLEPDEQDELLQKADNEKLTTREFRKLVNSRDMQTPDKVIPHPQPEKSSFEKVLASGEVFLHDLKRLANYPLSRDDYMELSDFLGEIAEVFGNMGYEGADANDYS